MLWSRFFAVTRCHWQHAHISLEEAVPPNTSLSDGIVRTRATPRIARQLPPPTGQPASQPRIACAPYPGHYARLGSRWTRLPHAGLVGEWFLPVKSCVIGDIDLRGPTSASLALQPCAPYHRHVCVSWGSRRSTRARMTRFCLHGAFLTISLSKSCFMMPIHFMGAIWSHGAWFSYGGVPRRFWRVRVHVEPEGDCPLP
jgi:hypothetical protein